jgi:hypothetical protein
MISLKFKRLLKISAESLKFKRITKNLAAMISLKFKRL